MLNEAQVQALTTQVLWAAFALALAFGAIAQRTHFCTMGAVADIVNDGRLVAHAHVGAGRRRGDARLQRAWWRWAGCRPATSIYADAASHRG